MHEDGFSLLIYHDVGFPRKTGVARMVSKSQALYDISHLPSRAEYRWTARGALCRCVFYERTCPLVA